MGKRFLQIQLALVYAQTFDGSFKDTRGRTALPFITAQDWWNCVVSSFPIFSITNGRPHSHLFHLAYRRFPGYLGLGKSCRYWVLAAGLFSIDD